MSDVRHAAGPVLQISRPAEFGEGSKGPFLLRNFHPPEDGFAWSTGRWCEVEFSFDLTDVPQVGDLFLELELDVFHAPPLLPTQDVFVYLNGLRLGGLTVRARQFASFRFRRAVLQAEANVLTIDSPEAARPSDFGFDDRRLLGVKLWSMSIETAPPAAASGV